ncbi:MAG: chitobiase/beta-hexosaminidase C-terminal domain-containing protein [Oscillospiraceae bacterium]|nr:chitobiase/beta-hexosaminidase C-terminal domain-containing protein [Oscillospiraceae bacterium]
MAILLVLALMLCLIPVTALADDEKGDDAEPVAEETTQENEGPEDEPEEDAEEPTEPEEDAEEPEEEAEEPEEDEEAEPITNGEDETCYATGEDTVYNNGGVVYNNGGTVYNNGGTVYNNDGIVYNNNGVVYSNGGTVYNNGGTVYSNSALVYTFGGDVEEARIYGFYRVETAEDLSALADIQGLTDEGYLGKDQVCSITPHEGLQILEAETTAGTLTENEDGSYSLSELDADCVLTIRFQAEAPVFSLEEGTYGTEQSLEIAAAEGLAVYYTTDGSEPDAETGTLYAEPIALSEGTTVKAVAVLEGAEPSEIAEADYAFVSISAPSFDDVTEGYALPAAGKFTVENTGSVDAVIKSIELQGDDAASFTLNSRTGATVKAGKTNETWTIRPVAGLKKGTYKVSAVFTLDSGETVELKVSFKVK